jgi:murein DD-endopeptidase MepM/ murein hydrolase activator NlpD
MLIPHNGKKSINLKIPSIGVVASVMLWFIGTVYVISIAVDTASYYDMKDKLNFYTGQFVELRDTINTLKKAEDEFSRILSFKSRKKILENVDAKISAYDVGALDTDLLKEQISNSIESVDSIKKFLKEQKNIYMATPQGWPVAGKITSDYGQRENPINGRSEFHPALDISAHAGVPVKATADGVVSFSGWSKGNGNLVVIEHGFGFSTLYAHNSSTKVQVGQKVKRGDIIALVGSTGNATGPHVHYEIWVNGKSVNPKDYILEAKNVP